jgi:pimeloyl-ACP methyl ester carboxylesterase
MWTDCDGGFQCASATVPLDYEKPRDRMIEVALIRLPAADQANRIGSLFLNPGGPGESGIEFVRTAPPGAFQLFAQFDIIGFDPRGLGASRPAVRDCGGDPSFEIPMPRPTDTDQREFLVEAGTYAKRCRQLNGELLSHLSSANVARDLDLLRAAVGDERLNYIGISYGGVIGATYASLFPGRTRTMVLDSPIDVQSYYDRPIKQWREHAEGHEHALDRFLAACASSTDNCSFGDGNPAKALEQLLAQLDNSPVPSSDPADQRTVSGDLMRRVLEGALRSRSVWPSLAGALAQAQAGDGRASLQLFDRLSGDALSNDFLVAVLGVDQAYRPRPVRDYFELAERSYNEYRHFWFLSGYWDLVRATWPVQDRDAFRGRINNSWKSAPILVVGMTHDPATPYVQAQRLTADLGNARLLTFEADGHGAVTSFDPCVLDAVVSYVHDGTLPPEGSVCVQQGEAFPAPRQ